MWKVVLWLSLGLVAAICIADARRSSDGGGWTVNGTSVQPSAESTLLGLLSHLPILAGANVTVTQTATGTVVSATRGGVTNRYGWIPADYLYQSQLETLSNTNGQAVFTKHSMTQVNMAGPISCPTPEGYTSNMTCRWYTYHTGPGTYAMACRWREGGLKAWSSATSGLFEASTSLTNLSTAALSVIAPAGGAALLDLEYWMVPTNAPGGGTAGGTGYVRGMEMVFGERL
jgi:hypothetical protein